MLVKLGKIYMAAFVIIVIIGSKYINMSLSVLQHAVMKFIQLKEVVSVPRKSYYITSNIVFKTKHLSLSH